MSPTDRRKIYKNAAARSWTSYENTDSLEEVARFHRSLPGFRSTRLVSLDALAKEIGVNSVFVKDETSRWGLPAFKCLGASWATHRAIVDIAKLPLDVGLAELSDAAKSNAVKLFAATDGNHGQAVARMAKVLGIECVIFVPMLMDEMTQARIASEGAAVVVVHGDYDAAVQAADNGARTAGGTLIQDNAFEGYEVVPKWIVDGYSTLVREIDEEIGANTSKVFVVPVGVGSLAQAVTSQSKAVGRSSRVLAVEPQSAACLWESLQLGENKSISTQETIMAGMCCGTVSPTAWTTLKAGVDASVTVSDSEAHESCVYFQSVGISAGPCGASTLAALKYVARNDPDALGLTAESIVILICTEGKREYEVPVDEKS